MPSRCCEFVDSRLRRSPPGRASAVPHGQAGENAMRFPHLAHRSAAAHKLHSTPQQHGMILISGNGEITSRLHAFSLFFPGSCPNNRDHRRLSFATVTAMISVGLYGQQSFVDFRLLFSKIAVASILILLLISFSATYWREGLGQLTDFSNFPLKATLISLVCVSVTR